MARKKQADTSQAVIDLRDRPPTEEECEIEIQAQSEENICYLVVFCPGFHSGWRAQFDLDSNGCLVGKQDVDYRRKGNQ